jgi:ribosomal protein S27E
LSKPVRISEPYVNFVDIKGNNIGFDVCPCCYNKGIDIEDVADQDDKQAEDG